MMSFDELSEIFDQNIAKSLGFTKEQFISLPDYCRYELIKRYIDINKKILEDNGLKKQKDCIIEKRIKSKVLLLLRSRRING